ncbi:MAG: protein kinase domain-containing protein [Chloroflexia bacterium]
MADRMAGRVLNGRYELQGVLGGGGMALVYRALDRVLNRIVAVKILREQYASDPTFQQRFTREAQSAAGLSHPNIVSVYDVGTDGDLPYIVMELVPGITLRDLLARDGRLPVDQAVEVAAGILSALEYAHRNGLIHRDIKPGNVLITPSGAVKVVDFGIAKSASDLSLTGAGMALGTAAYFSPEQARGEAARVQSDIYSLGVTLYEMLTGRPPFESDSDVGTAYKQINEAPIPPRRLNPTIPAQLEAIVLRALAKNPAARFGSAGEMEQALRNYAAFGAQATAAVPRVAPPPAPARAAPPPQTYIRSQTYRGGGSPWLVWLLGMIALLVLLGVAVSALTGSFLGLGSATATPDPGLGTPYVPLTVGGITPVAPPTSLAATATPVPTNSPVATEPPSPTQPPAPTDTALVPVAVPNLVGKSLGDAQAAASALGLKVAQAGTQNDPAQPDGAILSQKPDPDTKLNPGSTISIVVNKRPQAIAMPNVINTNGDQALNYLSKPPLNLKVVVKHEESGSVQAGAVTRQDPDTGAQVRPGDTVTIWVSTGSTATPVPPTRPPAVDTPTSQPPPEDTPTPQPPPEDTPTSTVPVPDVVGQSEKDALRILEAAGLLTQVVKVKGDQGPGPPAGAKSGDVVGTDPPPGTQVPLRSTVQVMVLSGS